MLGGDQTITICARARMRTSAADAFAFLAAPCNHRRLQVAGIRLLSLDEGPKGALAGGVFALDGPLGMRRIARTRVTLCQPTQRLAGSARLDSGTEAHVSWTLRPAGEGAVEVELTAVLGPIAGPDRLALGLGGCRWIRERFRRTLLRLAAELGCAPAAAHAERRAPPGRSAGTRGVTQPA